jgi:serine/threonine protein kinase
VSNELTTLPPQKPARAAVQGQKLGKYELRREVGRGGMGVVYEAYDATICRRVALKTLCSDVLNGPETDSYVERLRREAQAAGRLTHPNIVAVYDFGEEPQAPGTRAGRVAYITMEFVEGRELQELLAAQGRLAVPDIVRIMGQLLDALEYSHKNGVVHRDIKPSNIMLLEDGTVKVTDFGIARIESSTLTRAGAVMGSPSYMAPEQFLGVSVDARSDLYSAGVVLYELLAGEVPFPGSFSTAMHKVLNDTPTPISALNVHAPEGIDVLLGRALSKKPAGRFQSAAEFKQALLATLVAATAGKPLRKRKPWATIAACVIAGAGAGATYLAWNSSRGPAVEAASATMAMSPLIPANPPVPPPNEVIPQITAMKSGTAALTAVGLADPQDPRIAVEVRVRDDLADPALRPQRSALAENVLMDRIRSFGFIAVDAASAQPAPDFLLSGAVSLKHLSATLPASGLKIEKVALTSWTIRAVDPSTGEEVYLNTTIPDKRSWATEDQALQEIGRLIGSQFSREFFLRYFDFGTRSVRLRFKGLPSSAGEVASGGAVTERRSGTF